MAFYSKYMDEPHRANSVGWSNFYFVQTLCPQCKFCEESQSNWPIRCSRGVTDCPSRKSHAEGDRQYDTCKYFAEREKESVEIAYSKTSYEEKMPLIQENKNYKNFEEDSSREQIALEKERRRIEKEIEEQQQKLQEQQWELERQEEKRQESLRLDYCGFCHNPIHLDYEEIGINRVRYRIHKTCMEAFMASETELFLQWQDSEKRLKKQKEIVEKWIAETDEGKKCLEEFNNSFKKDAPEDIKIHSLLNDMERIKEEKEELKEENDRWIKETEEGKIFNDNLSEKDPDKRIYLIHEAHKKYIEDLIKKEELEEERKQKEKIERDERNRKERDEKNKLDNEKKSVIQKLIEIQKDLCFYFDKKTKTVVEPVIQNQIQVVTDASDVSELDISKKITEINLEKLHQKRKILNCIRFYFDICTSIILCLVSFSYFSMEKNLKQGCLYATISLLFILLPIIRKINFNKRNQKINKMNVEKIKDIIEIPYIHE